MFIYVIVCNESLKLYVGQHKGTDLQKYLHQKISHALRHEAKGSALYNAMRAHPKESWSIWPLALSIETRAELDELERHYIRVLKAQNKSVGYNICRGGEGFTGPHSEKSKAKTSASLREKVKNGWTMSLDGRASVGSKNAINLLGHKQSDETKAKHSAATKSLVDAGILPSGRTPGFKHSEETRAKMSESAKTRGITPETHQKMYESRKAGGFNVGHPDYTTLEGVERSRQSKIGKLWSDKRRSAHLMKTVAWG